MDGDGQPGQAIAGDDRALVLRRQRLERVVRFSRELADGLRRSYEEQRRGLVALGTNDPGFDAVFARCDDVVALVAAGERVLAELRARPGIGPVALAALLDGVDLAALSAASMKLETEARALRERLAPQAALVTRPARPATGATGPLVRPGGAPGAPAPRPGGTGGLATPPAAPSGRPNKTSALGLPGGGTGKLPPAAPRRGTGDLALPPGAAAPFAGDRLQVSGYSSADPVAPKAAPKAAAPAAPAAPAAAPRKSLFDRLVGWAEAATVTEATPAPAPARTDPAARARQGFESARTFARDILRYVSPRLHLVKAAYDATGLPAKPAAWTVVSRRVPAAVKHAGIAPAEAPWIGHLAKLVLDDQQAAREVGITLGRWSQAQDVDARAGELGARLAGMSPEHAASLLGTFDQAAYRAAVFPLGHLHVPFRPFPHLQTLFPTPAEETPAPRGDRGRV